MCVFAEVHDDMCEIPHIFFVTGSVSTQNEIVEGRNGSRWIITMIIVSPYETHTIFQKYNHHGEYRRLD